MLQNQISLLNISKDDLFDLMVEAAKSAKDTISSKEESNELLTRQETSKLLNINSTTLWRWTNSKKLVPYGIGGRVYYKRSEVLEAVKSLK
ncbi:helix-turn-helix domain-containing protein [Empedobacter brevis]|uniref:helix-turn-helix domain-containing protein n=1 Tax=Empedobacter brevis TaxID=247 RepID=UPI0028B09830|nr:helix-turn-helix domain-containing protein [Empedobacter brevis]